MIDGGRQWWLAATAATAFLYLTKAYVATCNGHATRAFIKCKNMWLKEVGSNGQGVAVCAVAVDAAIDAMVVNVRGGPRSGGSWCCGVNGTLFYLNVCTCGGAGDDGGRRRWQWALGKE